MNIVIVDDEHVIRKGLRKLIERSKTDARVVGEAGDGVEALALLQTLHCDLLIADIRMPVMDGLELIEQIRSRNIPTEIAILSGFGDFSCAQDAIRLGVTDFILKPMRPALVEDMLMKVNSKITKRILDYTTQSRCFQQCSTLVAEIAEAIWQLNAEVTEGKLDQIRKRLDDLNLDHEKRLIVQTEFLSLIVNHLDSRSHASGSFQNFMKPDEPDVAADAHRRFALAIRQLTAAVREMRNLGQRGPILAAIEYIGSHYDEPGLSLADLLQITGLSATYFYELFRAETGQSFKGYLIQTRIEKAKALLTNTHFKGYEVGEKVGYPDYVHFTKLFKKIVGISPTEYKKTCRVKIPG